MRRFRGWSRGGIIVVLGVTLLVAGCGENAPSPTATFVWPTALPASPTVNPVAPVEEGPVIRDPGQGMAGASSATEAGLAAEGEPDQQQPTITPQPTKANSRCWSARRMGWCCAVCSTVRPCGPRPVF